MTNAERIRAMSCEELSQFMTLGGFGCEECRDKPATCALNCEERCLAWLKESADTNGNAVEDRIAQTFMGDSRV